MGLTEPFFGPIFEGDLVDLSSSPSVDVGSHRLRGVEAEWAFVLGSVLRLPACSETEELLTLQQVQQAVSHVMPVIEVVASRLDVSALDDEAAAACARGSTIICDQAGHGQLLMGTQHTLPLAEWQQHYSEDDVSVFVNGQECAVGSPRAVLGNPMVALQWVLNNIAQRYDAGALGQQGPVSLPVGTIITTGTMTGITPVQPGDELQVRFGRLGQVGATISSQHSAHP